MYLGQRLLDKADPKTFLPTPVGALPTTSREACSPLLFQPSPLQQRLQACIAACEVPVELSTLFAAAF